MKVAVEVIVVLGQWNFNLQHEKKCLKFAILLNFHLNFIDVQDKSEAVKQV